MKVQCAYCTPLSQHECIQNKGKEREETNYPKKMIPIRSVLPEGFWVWFLEYVCQYMIIRITQRVFLCIGKSIMNKSLRKNLQSAQVEIFSVVGLHSSNSTTRFICLGNNSYTAYYMFLSQSIQDLLVLPHVD